MIDIEKLKKYFEMDRYCLKNGIVIEAIEEDYAACGVEVNENHLNAGDAVQGGLIFTLGDFAFALHANSKGELTVSQSADISYLKPAKSKKLSARAELISRGGRTCLYKVEIKDENGTLIAYMTVKGYILGKNPALTED